MSTNHLAPPPEPPCHRRAQSDASYKFSSALDMEEEDDFLFDVEKFNLSSFDIIPPSRLSATNYDDSAPTFSASLMPPEHSLRSLSVDSDFFEGLSFGGGSGCGGGGGGGKGMVHRKTNSVDGGGGGGSSSSSMEGDRMKKAAMRPDKLAELALTDPKRAKRILANRQSAARSKERKLKFTNELERKVQTLQTDATNLSAQLTLLERDASCLNVENKELKLRLTSLEQQAKLRYELKEALRNEVNRLKIERGGPISNNRSSNKRLLPQFPPQLQNLAQFGGHQNQQQAQPQQQFQMPTQNQPSASHRPLRPTFFDFNHGA